MSDFRVFAPNDHLSPTASGSWLAARGLKNGSLYTIPWIQALTFEGKVFGMQAGSVTTPIAGHAAIDADQPEGAVRVPSGFAAIPLSIQMAMETGATTLAQGGMMCAVSNIDVGAGTATAFTPLNMNMISTVASSCLAHHTYSGNGTDPLTVGNFIELKRISGNFDADAAGQGAVYPFIDWSVVNSFLPIVANVGSILAYGEAAANTLFLNIVWAEMAQADIA